MRRRIGLTGIVFCLLVLWLLAPPRSTRVSGTASPPEPADGPGVVVFDLQDGASEDDIATLGAKLGLTLEYSSEVSQDEALLRAVSENVAATLKAAAGDPLIEVVEPVVMLTAHGDAPNDPLWDRQWNMRAIGAPEGWPRGGGSGVRVAVIDTGITAVEDLAGVSMEAGRSFVRGSATAADDRGHGTHVAGTIAQATNNGIGVAGIAPGVTLVPYKVLGASGGGKSDAVAAAIDLAADEGADVINLSLGGGHSGVVHKAAQDAAARGVIVVASAGNTGRRGLGCPAHARDVIGVAAVGPNGTPAPYSSFGEGVEIAAPGGDKTVPGGGIVQNTVSPGGGDSAYLSFQGTSMAAPHVSGAAAVLLGTGLAPDAVIDALYRSAVDIDSDGFDERTGHGLLDLGAALGDTRRDGGALLAGSAGALALFIGVFAGLRRESLVPLVALSAFVGGGLFVAEPLGALAQGAWAWPTALFGPSAAGFPGWASALVPLLLALTLGPHPKGWVVAAAIAVGFAVGLWWGAASGFIDTWWVANPVEWLWLAMNALICVVVAMAVVGLRKARQRR